MSAWAYAGQSPVSPQLELLRPELGQLLAAQFSQTKRVWLVPRGVPGTGSPGRGPGSGGEPSACLSPTLLISIHFGPFQQL